MRVAELRAEVARELGSPREATWLLEDVLGSRSGSLEGDRPVADADRITVSRLVGRRRAGEPLQYVLGHWSFRGLELVVDGRGLIPRPETEQLVDLALAEIVPLLRGRPDPRVVDLGTGTGAIALALYDELAARAPGLEIWAVDDSPAALELAGENLAREGPSGSARPASARPASEVVHLRLGSWWQGLAPELAGTVDLVVSNPPYVSEQEWPDLDPEVRRHEPRHALVAGDDSSGRPGMAALVEVLEGAPRWLARPGTIVVELAPAQAEAARATALEAGLDEAEIRLDLSGRRRFVVARQRA
jgi:release factor glutamine methyltransferase